MSCQKATIRYGWAASLYLDGSSPHLFIGCRSDANCARASTATTNDKTRIITYAIMGGTNGDPITYNTAVRIAQVRGGSECGVGRFLSITFSSGTGDACNPVPLVTMSQFANNPPIVIFDSFSIVPASTAVGDQVTYNEPFYLSMTGPTSNPGPFFLGPPNNNGDLTMTTDQSKAAKFQFWLGDTYVPDQVACKGDCFLKGTSCYDYDRTLCPSVNNPNFCANTTIQANCAKDDETGLVTYDCKSAAPCTTQGSTCYDLAPELCPNPDNPSLCANGSTAICGLNEQGIPTYNCGKKDNGGGGLSTAWIIGLAAGGVALIAIIIGIAVGVSKSKAKSKTTKTAVKQPAKTAARS